MRPRLAHMFHLVFFLGLCHVAYSANGTTENSVCKRMKGGGDVGKKGIFLVGKMSNYFLVVTMDLFIYELQLTSLHVTINQLYFGNVTPTAMKDRWPTFWNSACFKRIHPHIYDGFTVRDRNGEYVVMTVPETVDRNGGCTYDLTKNEMVKHMNWVYVGNRSDLRMISAETVANYYGISKNPDGVLGIDKYDFCYSCSHGVKFEGHVLCSGGTLRESTYITPKCLNPTYFPMCREGSDKLSIERNNNSSTLKSCAAPVNWNIFAGFVDAGTFYFLGSNYVFIFSEKAWTTKGVKVSLQAVSFGSFINCAGAAQARDLAVSKKSPVRFGLLVAIILIIVLLILCCLLCLIREALERRKKKNKGGKDDGSKASSWLPTSLGAGAGNSGKPGSNRSSGLPGFGFLTGKKPSTNKPSKSKRSTGLPRGGSLSKKGVPGTKRSRGGDRPDDSISRKGGPGTKRSRALNGGKTVTGAGSRDPGASNRSGPSKRKGGGGSSGASGSNNVTGRSRGMRTAAGSRGKRSTSRGASNKATERSNIRKR